MKKIIFLLYISFFFCSCAIVKDYFIVATGNYNFEEGSYVSANYRYLQALKGGHFSQYVSYNLGNVYHDLGAMDTALEYWSRVDESADRDLRFRVAFNRGVFFYGRGDYNKAFTEFRKAIRIGAVHKKKKSMLAAKKNLELSLQKLNIENSSSDAFNEKNESGQKKEKKMMSSGLMKKVVEKQRLNWEDSVFETRASVEDY